MRIAVISDIHANLEAFEAVLRDISYSKVEKIISLGDNIGYGADPEPVMELLLSNNITSVLGNHEWACINDKVYRWYIKDVKKSLDMTKAMISEASFDYMKRLALNLKAHETLFVHGFPPDSVRHYLHQIGDHQIKKTLRQLKGKICFVGHTHRIRLAGLKDEKVQVSRVENEWVQLNENSPYIINVGSVGQPRDGDVRAKYILYDSGIRRLTIRKIDYDYRTAAQKILDAGMPVKYAQAVNPDISL